MHPFQGNAERVWAMDQRPHPPPKMALYLTLPFVGVCDKYLPIIYMKIITVQKQSHQIWSRQIKMM